MKPIIRPITQADYIEMTGEIPKYSLRGYACEKDEAVIGIAGVLHSRPLTAFSLLKPEIKCHKRIIAIAVKRFRQLLQHYQVQIVAIPNENEASANAFLSHVGFQPVGGVFVWAP